MRIWIALLAFAVSSVFGAHAASPFAAQKGGWHKDERYGFQFRVPKGWNAIPMQIEEGWIISKYLSDRQYSWTEEDGSWTWSHKPDVQVIAFVDQDLKTKVRKEKNKFYIESPYKDYKDFLRRTYRKGGWFVSEEIEDEVDGIKVTKLEIKVEKLSMRGPKRIVTWIFEAPGVDFAVQFEVLENHFDKVRKLVKRTLNSFKLIPRTAGGLPASTTGSGAVIVENLDKTLTPEERRKERIEQNRRDHAKVKENLPKGWNYKKFGRCLVVTNSDMKFAKRVTDQANAIMDWLDKNLGYIGPDETVSEPIIRILDKQEQEEAFFGTAWGWLSREIVIHKSYNGWEQSEVNRRVVELWLKDRDPELYSGMPTWLQDGLLEAFDHAKAKGRKLEFKTDGYERDDLREAAREGRLNSPSQLMLIDKSERFSNGFWTRRDEFAALVRFMLTDRKNKQNRGLFEKYITNLRDVIQAKAKAEGLKPKGKVVPATEEEEEEMFKKLRNAWKVHEKEILDKTWNRTFGDWGPKDWAKFDKAYYASIY